VLPIFEKEFPDDDRPRKAIEAARRCIDDPSDGNKAAAEAAAAWADNSMKDKIIEYGISLLEIKK
jgi:hypothetical protein